MNASASAALTPDITVRECQTIAELEACVRLQAAVWGFMDVEVVPRRMFVVARNIGGQVIGAFAGDTLIGFAMAIPGFRNGRVYLHSHMLAVDEAHRRQGIAVRLKLAQREEALARGITLMEWTFDPLVAVNAHLNITRLGAIARRYSRNHYGASGSVLQAGLPTDRLVAEWWLASRRVGDVLSQQALANRPSEHDVVEVISLPSSIDSWKRTPQDAHRARELQASNADRFESAFARGLCVLTFRRDGRTGNGLYELGHWNENRVSEFMTGEAAG